jgi:hypothetical protein
MRGLRLVLAIAAVAFAATPAQANTACYDWSCDNDVCTFDAGCTIWTTAEGTLWKYRWDFGDGSFPELTPFEVIHHEYPSNTCFAMPELTVMTWSVPDFTAQCTIEPTSCIGPIFNQGQCMGD